MSSEWLVRPVPRPTIHQAQRSTTCTRLKDTISMVTDLTTRVPFQPFTVTQVTMAHLGSNWREPLSLIV